MSSFFNDKGTFTPKNNIFEKIKNNFDLEKKTNSSSDVAKSQNSQKLSSYFRQRHGLLNSNLNSSNNQVSGVAKRLFPKKNPNIYNNNSSKDELNEFNIEYEKEKENLYKNPSSRNSSFISNISLTSSADIEFKDIPDLKKNVENKSTMIKSQSHIDVEKKSTPIIHNFRNLSGTKDYNKNKDIFLESENEPIVSTNSLIHNNSFSEKNKHEIKHNSTINNDTTNNPNNSGNTVPTLIDQSSNNILLDAFNSTQKICTSLKEELVFANNTINELNEENLEIKLQNKKAVESYNTIYALYSDLFEDLTNLKQVIFNKNFENNKLKEELNLLTNDLNDIKSTTSSINQVIKMLKHNVRQNELIIIEKDKEIVKKDEKINSLELNQNSNINNNNNNMVEEIISSLQALSIQTESNISNTFKNMINETTSSYLAKISTLLSDLFGEQQDFIQSNCKNWIDYNKLKTAINESIKENNLLTVENNDNNNLIKKELLSHINLTTTSTMEKHNTKIEASFKNINTVLNFNFENTTNTFVKKIDFVEEQLEKVSNLTNDLKKQNNYVVEKLSKIDSLEEIITNLKKDIILTGEKKIENLLNNSNLSSKAMCELQKMNQGYLPKIHNLNQSINDLKLSHNKININLDNKTVILERELIDLKKTIKDFQSLCKPSTTRVSSIESNNNTVINDLNFTRELSGTNEFDELLSSSSDSGSQQPHQKVKESKIITNSQEFMESYDHISQESFGQHSIIRSQQGIKKIKKVSFNNSVTILNNGSIVNLAEEFAETKTNLQNNMINELPNQNEKSKLSIFPTDTNHLNTIFSGNKFEESLRNKNLKKKVNKKRYVDKNCEEEEDNDGMFSDEGSSSILDAIFQNHFKGGIRKAKSSRTMANRRSNGTLMGSISSENASKETSSCNRKNKRNSISSKK